ncbi:transglutaminase [Streptomyces sp. LP11]|uniref:Transglutaminase n=1 Tax=Streptomyces pyxinicus TaxID=2970331 RepID=A0ABT2B5W0_9ACTN|nr:transglutaminase domain-containing protein [Streptomyces sp. LP11]MCS0603908.1 transglutaminase [Streptomyces sp. LP11]
MRPIRRSAGLSAYLATGPAVDHHHPLVRETAARPARDATDPYDYARAAYEFVRDAVPHSQGSGDLRVTWRASDVPTLRTGVYHAESHALAALLRAEDIPAALCCQRLTDDAGGHLVRGLVAVRCHGAWHRQEPGGTKPGVDARFSLDGERPAWVPDPAAGELDPPESYAAPHPAVLDAPRTGRRCGRTLTTALPG